MFIVHLILNVFIIFIPMLFTAIIIITFIDINIIIVEYPEEKYLRFIEQLIYLRI